MIFKKGSDPEFAQQIIKNEEQFFEVKEGLLRLWLIL